MVIGRVVKNVAMLIQPISNGVLIKNNAYNQINAWENAKSRTSSEKVLSRLAYVARIYFTRGSAGPKWNKAR
ncbi:hypothetical protein H058_07585 [Vibrio antiquarius]|nr:hypothetical protein H058_07585 [Vibrio antiquarius]